MKDKLAIKSNRVLTPQGIREALILIDNGEISAVISGKNEHEGYTTEDVGDLLVMPGIIDPHVHINEPGRTEWEGFDTATKAAAKGGVTTLIDMPLNSSPVTTSVKNFRLKTEAAMGQLHVNCGFWGGVVPENLTELDALLQSGVFGLKAFLTHSGIDDFPNIQAEHLRVALPLLKKYNKPLLVHCELDDIIPQADLLAKNPRSYSAYLNSRPASWENKAIKLIIDLCRETGARIHIVHLSSAEALMQIQTARKEGLPISVETGQHYLYFNAEQIKDGATEFKCAPPIRDKKNNEQLWEALKEGTIDFIATDHSPAPPELKEINSGNFQKAWGGIAGLQFALPVLWTAAKERGCSLEDISKWLSANVAAFLHLENSKGRIMKGYDADLVIWNPEKEFIVKAEDIQHRHKVSPYINEKLFGVVEQTYVYGQKVYDHGNYLHLNAGKILLKK